jgi:hypothetical protein
MSPFTDIWHEGNPSRVVRIGQGDIAMRITAHRNDRVVTKYRASGTLRVTWAAVPAAQHGDAIGQVAGANIRFGCRNCASTAR